MRKTARLLSLLFLLAGVPALSFAQQAASHDALAGQLAAEAKKLESAAKIGPRDVKAVAALDAEIQKTAFADLKTQGDLLLALYQGRETSGKQARELNASIQLEAATLKEQSSLTRRTRAAKAFFWTGVSSLGILATSLSVSSWAYDQYAAQTDPNVANDYFITGKTADLVTFAGIIVGVGSLLAAGVLATDLYSTPSAPLSPEAIPFPSGATTNDERVAYLDASLKSYAAQYNAATKARELGRKSLLVGLAGLAVTAAAYVAESSLFNEYNESILSSDAESYRDAATVLQWLALGTGVVTAVGFGGAYYGYVMTPDPGDIQDTITSYQTEREELLDKP